MSKAKDRSSVGSRKHTAKIVAAYISNNFVIVSELQPLIATVHHALCMMVAAQPVASRDDRPLPTSAQIRRSISPDGLVSFLDGRTYKTLKRHLTANGLDPHGYRERFGLPADYPMVAASYSEKRSGLAKALGLGQRSITPLPDKEIRSKQKRRRKAD